MEPTWCETAIAPHGLFLRWHRSADNRSANLIPSAAQYRFRALFVGCIALALTTFALVNLNDFEILQQRVELLSITGLAAIGMAVLCIRYCLTSNRFQKYDRKLSIDYDTGVFRIVDGECTRDVPLSSIKGLHIVRRHIESQLFLLHDDHGTAATLWLHTDLNLAMWSLVESFREIADVPLVSESCFDPKS